MKTMKMDMKTHRAEIFGSLARVLDGCARHPDGTIRPIGLRRAGTRLSVAAVYGYVWFSDDRRFQP